MKILIIYLVIAYFFFWFMFYCAYKFGKGKYGLKFWTRLFLFSLFWVVTTPYILIVTLTDKEK